MHLLVNPDSLKKKSEISFFLPKIEIRCWYLMYGIAADKNTRLQETPSVLLTIKSMIASHPPFTPSKSVVNGNKSNHHSSLSIYTNIWLYNEAQLFIRQGRGSDFAPFIPCGALNNMEPKRSACHIVGIDIKQGGLKKICVHHYTYKECNRSHKKKKKHFMEHNRNISETTWN